MPWAGRCPTTWRSSREALPKAPQSPWNHPWGHKALWVIWLYQKPVHIAARLIVMEVVAVMRQNKFNLGSFVGD